MSSEIGTPPQVSRGLNIYHSHYPQAQGQKGLQIQGEGYFSGFTVDELINVVQSSSVWRQLYEIPMLCTSYIGCGGSSSST